MGREFGATAGETPQVSQRISENRTRLAPHVVRTPTIQLVMHHGEDRVAPRVCRDVLHGFAHAVSLDGVLLFVQRSGAATWYSVVLFDGLRELEEIAVRIADV